MKNDPLKSVLATGAYMRLTQAGARDPLCGFTRSYLNTLILPCRENNYMPPVRNFSLCRPGLKRGVRLVDVASLRAFVEQQSSQPPVPQPVPATPPVGASNVPSVSSITPTNEAYLPAWLYCDNSALV